MTLTVSISQGCTGCKSPPSVLPTEPFDVEIHEMELCNVLKTEERDHGKDKENLVTIMDEPHQQDDEDKDTLQKVDKSASADASQQLRTTSNSSHKKTDTTPAESHMAL